MNIKMFRETLTNAQLAEFSTRYKKADKHLYLVTMPVELTSIFLKSAGEKNDGNLHISLVTGLNSGIHIKLIYQ